MKFLKVPKHLKLSAKNNIMKIDYQKLFKDAAIAWQENNFEPIHISEQFINAIKNIRNGKTYNCADS